MFGFLGTYTTFSTYALGTCNRFKAGNLKKHYYTGSVV